MYIFCVCLVEERMVTAFVGEIKHTTNQTQRCKTMGHDDPDIGN